MRGVQCEDAHLRLGRGQADLTVRPMRALFLVAIVVVAQAAAAVAGQIDPWTLLASSSFDDVRDGVNALAGDGDARALPVISALQDGALLVARDGTLLIRGPDGLVDARSGAKFTGNGAGLKKARVNNAVRSAVEDRLGILRLFAPDPAQREKAAESVFHAHDPRAIPALDRALAVERNATVRAAMKQARAACEVFNAAAGDAEKLAAIGILRARGGMDSRSVLEGMNRSSRAASVAAAAAVRAIDRDLQFWSVVQSIYYGISLGSVLLLAAAGLAITFGVMGVINMAHGEMVMLGAYTTFVVQQALGASFAGLGLLLSIPAAFAVSGVAGVVIERALISRLYGRPLETLLATWGLSLILQQAVRSIFGASNRSVLTPGWMSGEMRLGGLALTYNRLAIIIFAALVFAALMAVLRFTSLGLRMRAVTQNRPMAASMGIRTTWIDALTFGLGSGVAGMAGVALSQIDNVSPNLGQGYIIDSFMVVVFGGAGNLWGTALGSLTLGIVNKFLEPVAGAVLGKIAVLVMLILFIQRKPRGLFPLRGRMAEA